MLGLNNEQQEIVNEKAPLLVIAGPGTGKTHTLVSKIGIDLENYNEKELLILTFTNKAAKEINERIQKRMNKKIYYIGTFHSVFYKILKENNLNYFLLDENADLSYFLNEVVKKVNNEDVEYINNTFIRKYGKSVLEIYQHINSMLNKGIIKKEDIKKEILKTYDYTILHIYKSFEQIKQTFKLASFIDILKYTYELLSNNPEIREKYKNMFKHIYIDEFQDTNTLQMCIIDLIQNNNTIAIGDPLQSIYGFLDANIGNILYYMEHYKPTIKQLTKNYRSTPEIVQLINEFLPHFEDFKLPILPYQSINSNLEKPTLIKSNNIDDEIISLLKGDSQKEFSIILRKNNESFNLEKKLRLYNIAYNKISGDINDYPKEVEIIQLIVNFFMNKNLDNLRKILTYYKGIGLDTINALIYIIEKEELPINKDSVYFMFDVKDNDNYITLKDLIKNTRKQKLLDFFDLVDTVNISSVEDIKSIIDKLNLFEFMNKLDKDSLELAKINIENIYKYIENKFNFSSELQYEINRAFDKNAKVTITTAHTSKGLEWDNVILYDVSAKNYTENILDNGELLDEQKRLLYVACSRAKKHLYIFAKKFKKNGDEKSIDVLLTKIMQKNENIFEYIDN